MYREWNEIDTNSLVSRDLQGQEPGLTYRGPIKSFTISDDGYIQIKLEWSAIRTPDSWQFVDLDNEITSWTDMATVDIADDGRIEMGFPHIGSFTVLPADDKLDPAKVINFPVVH